MDHAFVFGSEACAQATGKACTYNGIRGYHDRTEHLRVGREEFMAPRSSVNCLSGLSLTEFLLYMSTMPFTHDKEWRIG